LGASPFSSATLIGSYFTWNSDNLFFGLRDYGNDRKDSVIMFGDNTNDNLRIQSNTLGTSSSVTGGGLISDLMMVTATGNVGIGTTDIADRLEVAKTGDFSYIRTTVDSSTKDAGIHLRYKEGGKPPYQWAILINGPSKGFMINDDYPDSGSTFNPAHRFFIEANTGDVGIGTVTPGTYSGEKVKADIAGYGAVDDIYLKNPKNGSARWASTVPLSTSGLFYCTQSGSGCATCYIGQHKACFLAGDDTTADDSNNYDGCVILAPGERTPMFQRTAVNNTNQWAIVIQCHGSDNYRCWARCLD
jgi:hypothetical protein